MNRWKALRYRLEWLGVSMLARLVPRLSRRTCVGLADVLGAMVFRCDRRSRQIALENLEAAFGDSFTNEQRQKIARASHQTFARTMLDLFWLPRLNRDNFQTYIELENFNVLTEARNGSISLNLHFGTFEWMVAAAGFFGHTGFGVTASFKNQLLASTFSQLREVSGHRMIDQERSLLRFLKALKRGGHVGMLSDLTLPPSQTSAVIECFGLKTCVPTIHAILHLRTGAPILPMLGFPLIDGRCRAVVYEPLTFSSSATPQEIAQACWDFFEPKVRENPQLWIWTYKHWRYRPKNASRPYPSYAHVSSNFEKLLATEKNLTKAAS